MRYTLITSTGRIMQFYILKTAECYQTIYGGQIIDKNILETCVQKSNSVV